MPQPTARLLTYDATTCEAVIMFLPCQHRIRISELELYDAVGSRADRDRFEAEHQICWDCLYTMEAPVA
jgi:hypothetical protein